MRTSSSAPASLPLAHLVLRILIVVNFAVLLTFLLARVFAEGARMRDDLEGTV
jgi:hypothetical protein